MHKLAVLLHSWGPAGAFALAVLDSAGVPLPTGVDALLVLVAITNPDLAWLTAGLTVVGSALGSMALFGLARKGGQLYLERHCEGERARRFRAWFTQYGLVTIFVPVLVPIPLPVKVFVLSAGALGVRPLTFLLVVLAARIPRYAGLTYLGLQLGENSAAWLTAHVPHLAGLAAALVAAAWLWIRWSSPPPAAPEAKR